MIHVIATITVKPGKRDALLAEFHRIVPIVRAEAGCIEYGPTVDVASGLAVQDPLRENVAVIIEKWQSLEALLAHTQASHMAEYRLRVKDLVESVQLQILRRREHPLREESPRGRRRFSLKFHWRVGR